MVFPIYQGEIWEQEKKGLRNEPRKFPSWGRRLSGERTVFRLAFVCLLINMWSLRDKLFWFIPNVKWKKSSDRFPRQIVELIDLRFNMDSNLTFGLPPNLLTFVLSEHQGSKSKKMDNPTSFRINSTRKNLRASSYTMYCMKLRTRKLKSAKYKKS